MKRVAISIGDLNGIGIEIALRAHKKISKIIKPIYIIDKEMLDQASNLLEIDIPKGFEIKSPKVKTFKIKSGNISKKSGVYSFASFQKAVELAHKGKVDAVCTLPIHKKAWEKAGLSYVGHTDFLREYFKQDAIMMLGSSQMYVALFTEHIPLREVGGSIEEDKLTSFLVDFYNTAKPASTVAVLGLNPHAGDDGVLGDEEKIISKAIENATKIINHQSSTTKPIFTQPMVPDIAFATNVRKYYTHYVAMYHDQGLAPLKALYFEEGINISLNLPILRTSVDHGTAFDIAYKRVVLNQQSYLNAIEYIVQKK